MDPLEKINVKDIDKRTFMILYVLSRANTNSGGLDGCEATKEAEKAWNEIVRRTQIS